MLLPSLTVSSAARLAASVQQVRLLEGARRSRERDKGWCAQPAFAMSSLRRGEYDSLPVAASRRRDV